MTALAVVLIAALGAGGQYLLKIAAGRMASHTLLEPAVLMPAGMAAVTYLAAFMIYTAALMRSEVSSLYPSAIGATFIAITLMAWLALGETISVPKLIGMGLVALGMLTIHYG